MSDTDLFDAPEMLAGEKIPRDGWKRPLVIPPGGIKAIAYTRCTTFVDCLEDKRKLEAWSQRQVALGLADRADLLLSVAAHRTDKDTLDDIVEQAKEAAKSSAKSNTGTALHAMCETLDRGRGVGVIPAAYQKDIRAYQAITRGMTHHHIEEFTVHDPFKVGGTPDRVTEWGGKHYVADLKTGSIEWGGLKIAMQLALYSRAVRYNHVTGKRIPYQFDVDQNKAIVIHLPAGEGIAYLHWVDIAGGWEAVQTARDVRKWRARRDWFTAIDMPAQRDGDSDDEPDPFAGIDPVADVEHQLAAAATFDELRDVWETAVKAGHWTDDHVPLAQRRRAEIERTVA